MAKMTKSAETAEMSESEILYRKAKELDQKYEASVMTANHEQTVYDHIAVRFKKRCRDIEVDRVGFTKKTMDGFLNEHQAYFANDSIQRLTKQMEDSLIALDGSRECEKWLDHVVKKYGNVLEMKRDFVYISPDYQNAFYALEDAMAITLKLDAAHKPESVPLMMISLTRKVEELDGFRTEGIFRISAAATDLDRLRAELKRHNYKFVDTLRDPHLPAGMLKDWLRNLNDSLIPTSHYDMAISMAQKPASLTPEALEVFLSQLPIVNRETIRYLCKFLQRLIDERNQPHTKMNVENISIVFAPTILKCPHDDPSVMMLNSKFEKDFTVQLITQL
jgi:hypothetical protein